MNFLRIYFFSLLFVFKTSISFCQTNPTAQALPYTQDFSGLTSTVTTYPAGWQGWTLGAVSSSFKTIAPTGDSPLTPSGTAASTTGAMYNYTGKIGLLQSGSADPGICLAIATTSQYGISVTYDAMTIRNPYNGGANTRINELTLQYRVGTSGVFTNLSVPYQNNTTVQTTAVTTPQNTLSQNILLPSDCDNQAVVQLRWAARDVSGAGARPSFAIDNINIDYCTLNTSGWNYRSKASGNWNKVATWQAFDGSSWIDVCMPPNSSNPLIQIQNGHTVTIDATTSVNNLTVDFGGTLQSNNTVFVTMSVSGDIINNGVFQMVNGSFGTEVNFIKNGSQTISGTGGTTNFYSIWMNMGASAANTLEVTSSNFSWVSPLFNPNPKTTASNKLVSGTFKLSGSALCSGSLILPLASNYSIPANAGIWINNSSATINAPSVAGSMNLNGTLRISAGQFNLGTVVDNSIRLLTNSSLIMDGGTLNVAGRIQTYASNNVTNQTGTTYNQSGGTVTVSYIGANVTSGGTQMPDLAIGPNNSFIMSGGIMVFRNEPTVADAIYHNGTSTITGGLIQFADANTLAPASPKAYYIESYAALPSLEIYKPSSYSPIVSIYNADLAIIGSITINNGTTLSNYNGVSVYSNLSLTKNWLNSGTFLNNLNKTVTFNGNTSQTIGGTSNTTFNNLAISNAAGVTLASSANVNNGLSLNNGLLTTTSTYSLAMSSTSSVVAVSNSSFVNGPMSKTGNTDFTFPVGKLAQYRPISVTSLSGSETFTSEYFNSIPSNLTLKDASIDHLSHCEYWSLDRDPLGTAAANVTLSWDTYSCEIDDLPSLTIASWDSGLSLWKDQGNAGTTGTIANGTIISNGTVSPFGLFTLGSTQYITNPLPIELLDFSAKYNGKDAVELNWVTANETNNNYFTIERSSDAISFSEILKKQGAGNSNQTISYNSIDSSPLKGVSYYRLKQTDFNGEAKNSKIVSVAISQEILVDVSGSVASGNLTITFNNETNLQQVTIELYDSNAKRVILTNSFVIEASSKIAIPIEQLREGIYFLRILNKEQVISKKIKL